MLKWSSVSACLALMLAWTAPASADVVTFQPSGAAGSAIPIDFMDPVTGNSLTQALTCPGGPCTPGVIVPGETFRVFFQANLGVTSVGGGAPNYTNGQPGAGTPPGAPNQFFTF